MSDDELETTRRLAASLAPQLREAMARYQAFQISTIQEAITRAFTPAYQQWLGNLQEVVVPALRLDYSSLFPQVSVLQDHVAKQLMPALALVHEAQREQFVQLLTAAHRAYEASLPPNWPRNGSASIPDNLESMLLDEGLPLAWLPPVTIVERLFKSSSAAERRNIIGRRWRTIGIASLKELDQIEDADLHEHVDFAREAADSLLHGFHRASQALSTNLLDTVLRAFFDQPSRRRITNQATRLDMDGYPLRAAIVLAGVWGSHGTFWPEQGDSIPRQYTRHGSAHGVSRRQYSRVNAVIALMHVVALLRLLDTDLR